MLKFILGIIVALLVVKYFKLVLALLGITLGLIVIATVVVLALIAIVNIDSRIDNSRFGKWFAKGDGKHRAFKLTKGHSAWLF